MIEKESRDGRKNESEREKSKEINVPRTRKLAQLNRAGKLGKDAKSGKSGTNLKLGRSKKNCVELLKNA